MFCFRVVLFIMWYSISFFFLFHHKNFKVSLSSFMEKLDNLTCIINKALNSEYSFLKVSFLLLEMNFSTYRIVNWQWLSAHWKNHSTGFWFLWLLARYPFLVYSQFLCGWSSFFLLFCRFFLFCFSSVSLWYA